MIPHKFSIRSANGQVLQGIQLHLSNSHIKTSVIRTIASPSIRGAKNIAGVKKVDYQCGDVIKYAAFRVYTTPKGDQEYTGIRLLNKEKQPIIFEQWDGVAGAGLGEWEFQQIPDGQKLIGFHGYIWNEYQIHMIGMIVCEK